MKKLVSKITDSLNRAKPKIDKHLDPLYFSVLASSGLAYATYRAVDYFPDTTPNRALGMLSTLAITGAAVALTNKYIINPISRRIRRSNQRKINLRNQATRASWMRSLAQYTIPALAIIAYPEFEKLQRKEEPLEERLENTGKSTPIGSFLRTYRWEEVFNEAENRYNIEADLLQGTAMHESQGDPLAISPMGAVGLMQFIPNTAAAYGLKVYDRSDLAVHRRKMEELRRKHHYNYELLIRIDDRFSAERSIEASARFLRDLYNRYGSWDRALSAYNQGVPAPDPPNTDYVGSVREKQELYQEFRKRLM